MDGTLEALGLGPRTIATLSEDQRRCIRYFEDAIRVMRIDPLDTIIDADWYIGEDDRERVSCYTRRLAAALDRALSWCTPPADLKSSTLKKPYVFKGTRRYFMLQEFRERLKALLLSLSMWAVIDGLSAPTIFVSNEERERAYWFFKELDRIAWLKVRARLAEHAQCSPGADALQAGRRILA